jgi:uncharacterized heparinase superfamily protein
MHALDSALRYWHTVRHLKPIQVYGRLAFHAWRPSVDLRAAPVVRRPTGTWATPARRRQSLVAPTLLRLLSVERDVAAEGWAPCDTDLLWRYNVHYFDDLNSDGATSRSAWHEALIERWIRDIPAGSSPAWDPYPLSTRLVNWIKYALAGGALSPRAIDSMAAQARWLSKRIEWHLQGNHLWINGKALIFAGLFFSGDEADRWMRLGTRIVGQELDVQILSDGGHFERSPMYHSLVVEDMLDLVNVMRASGQGDVPLCNRILERLPSARRWLAAMVHPDERISFFNDATFGVAPEPAELDRYAQLLQLGAPCPPADGITHLQPSGYVRLQRGPAVLIMDVGDVGPDFCPAHAHADTLAIELSLFGHRVVVNSGISCYGTGEERMRQRGTAAHSTVTVEGLDSSEVWSGFRVARRARPFGLALDDDGVCCSVACSHDGFASRLGGAVHRRRVELSDDRLTVHDRIEPVRSAVARYHLHPAVGADGPAALRLPTGQCLHGLRRVVPGIWRAGGVQSIGPPVVVGCD